MSSVPRLPPVRGVTRGLRGPLAYVTYNTATGLMRRCYDDAKTQAAALGHILLPRWSVFLSHHETTCIRCKAPVQVATLTYRISGCAVQEPCQEEPSLANR